MIRPGSLARATLVLLLSLGLASGQCHVAACSGDCDHHCHDEGCDHHQADAALPGPLAVPTLPGIAAPLPAWVPPGR